LNIPAKFSIIIIASRRRWRAIGPRKAQKGTFSGNKSQCFKHFGVLMTKNLCNLWLKICEICVHSFQPLTSTKVYVRNYKLFMQNKANFRKSQMNVNNVLTKDYEKKTLGERGKKQSQTKPIKANLQNAQMNVNVFPTKSYENKPPIWALKKQSQFSLTTKNNANLFAKKDYERNVILSSDKTNPNKPNLSRRSLWRSRNKPNFRGKK
jgi:hypothetical protein